MRKFINPPNTVDLAGLGHDFVCESVVSHGHCTSQLVCLLSRRIFARAKILVYSIGLRHSADPFTFREQRFQSFSARFHVYQGRFRDFLRAFEPALEALGGVLELSWSYFGPFHEHP